MGMLDPNTLVGTINGKIGGLVFVRTSDGRVIVRHAPVRQAEFTGPELANQSAFAQAAAYVKKVRQDPEQYAPYEAVAGLKGKRACDLAHRDARRPPQITDIDLSAYTGQPGQAVAVEVVDDFGVVSVCLTFTQMDGTLLEHGAAVLDHGADEWRYATSVPVQPGQTLVVHVTAADRPGNAVTRTLHHALLPPA